MNITRQKSAPLSFPSESDTSEHSYRFERRPCVLDNLPPPARSQANRESAESSRPSTHRNSGERVSSDQSSRGSHPFRDASNELGPFDSPHVGGGTDTFTNAPPRLPFWRRALHLRPVTEDTTHASRSLRLSIDMPSRVLTGQDTMPSEMAGRVVRRRRRIPVWVAVLFGVATLTSLTLAICIAPLTIYNYRRIRSQRAARTIDDLSRQIVPLITAIYNQTVKGNGTRFP